MLYTQLILDLYKILMKQHLQDHCAGLAESLNFGLVEIFNPRSSLLDT